MIKHFLFWTTTIFLCFILQMILGYRIAIFGAVPNFQLLAVVFFALRYGSVPGEYFGFFLGLLADVGSISIFGSQTFVFTLIGYLCGQLRGKIDDEQPFAQMGLVLAVGMFYILGLYCLENMFTGGGQRFKISMSIIQPIYTALISPLIFWFLLRWSSWGPRYYRQQNYHFL